MVCGKSLKVLETLELYSIAKLSSVSTLFLKKLLDTFQVSNNLSVKDSISLLYGSKSDMVVLNFNLKVIFF